MSHFFDQALLRRLVLVLLLDEDPQLVDLLAELVAFLLALGCLVFEELPGGFELLVSGLYLQREKKRAD